MKNFLKNILLFLLPLVVLSFVLDYFLSNKLKANTELVWGEYAVWNDIFEGKINSDILIIGSSRAWGHFNPTMITDNTGISSYNIGMDGHPFLMQDARYNILRKYNKKPKMVIVSLESNSLFKRPDLYNSDQFLPYLKTNSDDFKEPLLKFEGFKKYDFKLPLVRYYGNFFVLKELALGSSSPIYRVKGFQGKNKKWNNDLSEAMKKFKSIKVKVDTSTLNHFKDFIISNKEEDIDVVLVYSPEYIGGQEFISNRDSIINLYKQISTKNKIPFLDFSNDSISYSKEYFYNATHLNEKGANLFTHKLIESLRKDDLLPIKD